MIDEVAVFMSQGFGDDHKDAVNAKCHWKPRDHCADHDMGSSFCFFLGGGVYICFASFPDSVTLLLLVRCLSVLLNWQLTVHSQLRRDHLFSLCCYQTVPAHSIWSKKLLQNMHILATVQSWFWMGKYVQASISETCLRVNRNVRLQPLCCDGEQDYGTIPFYRFVPVVWNHQWCSNGTIIESGHSSINSSFYIPQLPETLLIQTSSPVPCT